MPIVCTAGRGRTTSHRSAPWRTQSRLECRRGLRSIGYGPGSGPVGPSRNSLSSDSGQRRVFGLAFLLPFGTRFVYLGSLRVGQCKKAHSHRRRPSRRRSVFAIFAGPNRSQLHHLPIACLFLGRGGTTALWLDHRRERLVVPLPGDKSWQHRLVAHACDTQPTCTSARLYRTDFLFAYRCRKVRLSMMTGTSPTSTSASAGKAASPRRSSRASW